MINDPSGKAAYLNSVSKYLPNYPAIKALAYFDEDMRSDPIAGTTTPDSSSQSLGAFRHGVVVSLLSATGSRALLALALVAGTAAAVTSFARGEHA